MSLTDSFFFRCDSQNFCVLYQCEHDAIAFLLEGSHQFLRAKLGIANESKVNYQIYIKILNVGILIIQYIAVAPRMGSVG